MTGLGTLRGKVEQCANQNHIGCCNAANKLKRRDLELWGGRHRKRRGGGDKNLVRCRGRKNWWKKSRSALRGEHAEKPT